MKNLIILLVLLLGLTNIFSQDENKIICEIQEAFYIVDYNIFMTHVIYNNEKYQVWFQFEDTSILSELSLGHYYIYFQNEKFRLGWVNFQNIIPLKVTMQEYKNYIDKLNRKHL